MKKTSIITSTAAYAIAHRKIVTSWHGVGAKQRAPRSWKTRADTKRFGFQKRQNAEIDNINNRWNMHTSSPRASSQTESNVSGCRKCCVQYGAAYIRRTALHYTTSIGPKYEIHDKWLLLLLLLWSRRHTWLALYVLPITSKQIVITIIRKHTHEREHRRDRTGGVT